MNPTIARKFTLIDAMVLIAATAVALLSVRHHLRSDDLRLPMPGAWSTHPLAFILYCETVITISTPFVIAFAVALVVLSLRNPRPRIRRVFRHPGVTACIAICCVSIFTLLSCWVLPICCVYPVSGQRFSIASFSSALIDVCSVQLPMMIGGAVGSVWIILWLGRAWRTEPSWMDRTGKAVGVAGLIGGIVHGLALGLSVQ
jgi:hypothetical protein